MDPYVCDNWLSTLHHRDISHPFCQNLAQSHKTLKKATIRWTFQHVLHGSYNDDQPRHMISCAFQRCHARAVIMESCGPAPPVSPSRIDWLTKSRQLIRTSTNNDLDQNSPKALTDPSRCSARCDYVLF